MTNAELALLSLLSEQPRHGYDIEKVIDERGMRDWTEIGFSSIYYLLRKLEKEGLIEGEWEGHPGRGPARKVYALTPEGMSAVLDGVLEALSTPQPLFPPIQLGLANLPGVPKQKALAALLKYRKALLARSQAVQKKRDLQRPLPLFVEAMFSYSLAMIRAEHDWLGTFIQSLEEHDVQDRFQEGI